MGTLKRKRSHPNVLARTVLLRRWYLSEAFKSWLKFRMESCKEQKSLEKRKARMGLEEEGERNVFPRR